MGNSKNKDRNRNRPKGRKIKLKNVLNGRLGGRPRTSQPSQDITSDTDNDEAWQDITSDTDDDETWQESCIFRSLTVTPECGTLE